MCVYGHIYILTIPCLQHPSGQYEQNSLSLKQKKKKRIKKMPLKIMETLLIKIKKRQTLNINYEHGHYLLTVFGN